MSYTMRFNIYKLRFQSPVHLSKGKLNSYETSEGMMHSDALKSALFVSALQLFGEEEANLLMEKVVLSSAFPFDSNDYYLPRPLTFKPKEERDAATRKEAKKINYLTVSQFEAVINGREVENLLKKQHPTVFHRHMTQRVKVNLEDESEPFYMEKLYPDHAGSNGVYFICHGEYDLPLLEAALRHLGENGIGHQRNLGNGRFTVEPGSFDLNLGTSTNAWVSLSLYHPQSGQELAAGLAKSRYLFKKRGGWISSPSDFSHLGKRKKSILMFTEGSVFSFDCQASDVAVKGRMVDVRPDDGSGLHPVWRDGRSIFLPIAHPEN